MGVRKLAWIILNIYNANVIIKCQFQASWLKFCLASDSMALAEIKPITFENFRRINVILLTEFLL